VEAWSSLAAGSFDPHTAVAIGQRAVALARRASDDVAFVIGVLLTLWANIDLCLVAPSMDLMDEIDDMNVPVISRSLQEYRAMGTVFGPLSVLDGLPILRRLIDDPTFKLEFHWTVRHCLLVLLAFGGQFEEAGTVLRDIEAELSAADDLTCGGSGLFVGRYHVVRGDLHAAIAVHSRSVAHFARVPGTEGFASTHLGLQALYELELGERSTAESVLARAEGCTSPHDVVSVITNMVCRAVVAAQDGKRSDVSALSARALEMMDETDELFDIGEWRRHLARAHFAVGESDRAETLLQESRDAFARKGVLPMVKRVDRELARRAEAKAATPITPTTTINTPQDHV
jgi:hypothetical protein